MSCREQDIMISPESYFGLRDEWRTVREFLKDRDNEFTEDIQHGVQSLDYFFGIKENE